MSWLVFQTPRNSPVAICWINPKNAVRGHTAYKILAEITEFIFARSLDYRGQQIRLFSVKLTKHGGGGIPVP
jgi:hypothetical protein